MINDVLQKADYPLGQQLNGEISKLSKPMLSANLSGVAETSAKAVESSPTSEGFRDTWDTNSPFEGGKGNVSGDTWNGKILAIARLITAAENGTIDAKNQSKIEELSASSNAPVVGITGTGGAGKSSLVDELVRRFLIDFPSKKIAIISVDPSKRKTGGALLGDRIRMNSIHHPNVYMRSLATRQANLALSKHVNDAVKIVKAAGYDLVILESSGIGQSGSEIVDYADVSLYVMTPEYGAASQLEKIDMLDFADLITVNKFDKKRCFGFVERCQKTIIQRNHQLWTTDFNDLPVFGTIASQFNDPGTNHLYKALMATLTAKTNADFTSTIDLPIGDSQKQYIIPPKRVRYLSEISDNNRNYDKWVAKQSDIAQKMYGLQTSIKVMDDKTVRFSKSNSSNKEIIETLRETYQNLQRQLTPENQDLLWSMAAKSSKLQKRRVCLSSSWTRYSSKNPYQKLISQSNPQNFTTTLQGMGRYFDLEFAGKRARRVSLYSRRFSLQTSRRRPCENVCG